MSTVEKLIPIIREHSHQLVILCSHPEPTNLDWMLEVGEHLTVLSQIHDGTYREGGITLEVEHVTAGPLKEVKRQWRDFLKKIKK